MKVIKLNERLHMNIPFLDLKSQYHALKDEIHTATNEVMESTAFAGGPFVSVFEKELDRFCDYKHAIGVGNSTDALGLSLLAHGIGSGDEVITVPDTFIATPETVTYCGAKPVFVDVDETTYNMNPALTEAAITPRTKAITPVHLFGQTADMAPILAVAKAPPSRCRRCLPGPRRRVQGAEGRLPGRYRLLQFLIHCPVPVHLQDVACHFPGLKADSFPVTEPCAGVFISLPMFPVLKSEQIVFVADSLAMTRGY